MRFKLLVALNELDAAAMYAGDVHQWHDKLFRRTSIDEIARQKSPSEAARFGKREDVRRAQLRTEMTDFFDGVRELDVLLDTRADLATTLRRKEYSGFEFVKQIRQEEEAPFVLVAA